MKSETLFCKKCNQLKYGQEDRPYVNYCKDCYPKKVFTCIWCDELKEVDEKIKGKHYCKKCWSEYYKEYRRKKKEVK